MIDVYATGACGCSQPDVYRGSALHEPLNDTHNHRKKYGQNNTGDDGKIKPAFFSFNANVARQLAEEIELASEKIHENANCRYHKTCNHDVFSCCGIHLTKVAIAGACNAW